MRNCNAVNHIELIGPLLACIMHHGSFLPSDMGHRRSASFQEHVGALLSRSQRNCVSSISVLFIFCFVVVF